MARTEAKFSYGSTSEQPDDLDGDHGGQNWELPFQRGAISSDHIDSDESQKPRRGAGFANPKDGMAVTKTPIEMFQRGHIDAPWNKIEWPADAGMNHTMDQGGWVGTAKTPSAARSRASCSDECLTGSGEGEWYGAPEKRQK